MSEPRNHHWLPQFMMFPWCGADGLVTSFHKPRDRVHQKRKSPKSLGSQDYLYSVYRGPFQKSINVEVPLFTEVFDTPVAILRDRMLKGEVGNLTIQEKELFTAFILMLLLRRADSLGPSMKRAEGQWRDMVLKVRKDIYGVEYSESEMAQIYENELQGMGAFEVIKAAVDAAYKQERVIQFLLLEWRVLEFTNSNIELVLADNPVRLWGENNCVQRVFLPLAPRKLLVMASDKFFSDSPIMREEFRECLALDLVIDQFGGAKRFVVAKDLGINQVFLQMAEKEMGINGSPRDDWKTFSSIGWRE